MFQNRYKELRSGWAIALSIAAIFTAVMPLILVLSVMAAASIDWGGLAAAEPAALTEAVTGEINGVLASPWINYGMYILQIGGLLGLFCLLYKRPLSHMGLHPKGWLKHLLFGGLFGIVSIGLAVAALAVTGAAEIGAPDWSALADSRWIHGFFVFVMVGFFEEILSRGFMMTALKTTRKTWLIVSLPAVIFGLLHAVNPNVTAFSLLNIMLVGILFAYLFIKTGRLWAPIGYHITWNFF